MSVIRTFTVNLFPVHFIQDERLSSFDSLTSEDQRNILNEIINNLKNATQPRTDGLFPQDLNISNNLLQSMIPRLMVDSLEEVKFSID